MIVMIRQIVFKGFSNLDSLFVKKELQGVPLVGEVAVSVPYSTTKEEIKHFTDPTEIIGLSLYCTYMLDTLFKYNR